VSGESCDPPTGGIIVMDQLQPPVLFEPTPDLVTRRARLARFVAARNPGGFLTGDRTKGGRLATPDERRLWLDSSRTTSQGAWSSAGTAASGGASVSTRVQTSPANDLRRPGFDRSSATPHSVPLIGRWLACVAGSAAKHRHNSSIASIRRSA
jgi:hypothetical protein